LANLSDRRPERRRVDGDGLRVRDVSMSRQFTKSPIRPIRGFTLIELLIVLSIIMVLASMGLAQYRNSVQHSKEAVLKQDLFLMRDAIDQYYADKGQYPATLDALVSDGYLRGIPKDPVTDSTSTWLSIPAEPNPNNPTVEAGVFDVKSGSDKTALNGEKYADW
jgi:general secretion pathway protein G